MSNTKCFKSVATKFNIIMHVKMPQTKVIQFSRACLDGNKPSHRYFISSIALLSFLITTNNQLDCNILISLLLEGKSLKIAQIS